MAIKREQERRGEIEREQTERSSSRSEKASGNWVPLPLRFGRPSRFTPSSNWRFSSACQLVPWRRDGTVVAWYVVFVWSYGSRNVSAIQWGPCSGPIVATDTVISREIVSDSIWWLEIDRVCLFTSDCFVLVFFFSSLTLVFTFFWGAEDIFYVTSSVDFVIVRFCNCNVYCKVRRNKASEVFCIWSRVREEKAGREDLAVIDDFLRAVWCVRVLCLINVRAVRGIVDKVSYLLCPILTFGSRRARLSNWRCADTPRERSAGSRIRRATVFIVRCDTSIWPIKRIDR